MDALRLGFPATAVHEASAAAVARVLEAHEHEVDNVPLDSDAIAGAIASGGIDLLATAWLPLIDADWLGGRMQPIGLLYRPMLVWCVAAEGVLSLADLAASTTLDRRIVVPARGAPNGRAPDGGAPDGGVIAVAAGRAFDAYALGKAGYVLDPVSDVEALAWAEAVDPARVVPLCQPHPLLHDSRLRVLDDPRGALGPAQEARLLIRDDLRGSLDPDLIDELDELTLGNRVVSAMAHAMRIQGMSAEAAADAWQRGKLTPRG